MLPPFSLLSWRCPLQAKACSRWSFSGARWAPPFQCTAAGPRAVSDIAHQAGEARSCAEHSWRCLSLCQRFPTVWPGSLGERALKVDIPLFSKVARGCHFGGGKRCFCHVPQMFSSTLLCLLHMPPAPDPRAMQNGAALSFPDPRPAVWRSQPVEGNV